jgi:hypothetical protein
LLNEPFMYRTLLKSWPLAALTVLGCGSEPVHPDRAFGPVVATDAALHLVRIHAPEGLGELTVEVGQMTHGGMRGHWDLSRGPRERNHCVACHDPHAPAFGQFEPVPGPRDRFTGAAAPHGDAHD